MNFDADEAPELRTAHVIVVANEKGGSGKSTMSIHLAVALLKAGYRVATIDLDIRQRTLTRFFENRASWAKTAPWRVELPKHFAPDRGESASRLDNETAEFAIFAEAIGEVEHSFEFIVIDTPASDSYLMRLAHSLADTLISPMNDSFIDMDVLTRVHHDRGQRGMVAQYAEIVIEARRKRRLVDNGLIDWVLVRNRVATLQTNNAKQVDHALRRLAVELQFRVAEGLHDRVIFRELFPLGLTALDALEESHHTLTASQKSARREIDDLVNDLRLPERAAGVGHLESRHIWFNAISDFYRKLGELKGERPR
ncbi:division plane positioning ATPase MipZ [Rhodoblastus sp.]|uniref:division plane positioning ATPase MipZ n=1 Tax=Rhodoblastus sp. TaxID=1962975 RepID=UPI003F974303